MEPLLFLIVFVISCNYGTARPIIDGDFDSVKNGIDAYTNDDFLFKLPTRIKLGMTIHINGTLNTRDKKLQVILGDNNKATEECKVTIDFLTKTSTVTPGIQGYDQESYDFELYDGVPAKFSLRIIARKNDHQENLAFHFQINEEGESPQLICDVTNYENITYFLMQEGVSEVQGMMFKFG